MIDAKTKERLESMDDTQLQATIASMNEAIDNHLAVFGDEDTITAIYSEIVETATQILDERLRKVSAEEVDKDDATFLQLYREGQYQAAAELAVQNLFGHLNSLEMSISPSGGLRRTVATCLGVILRRHAQEQGR